MHDPKSVAHQIRWPFKDKRGYKKSILTIWHNDPEHFRFKNGERKLGCRDDDSCGWLSPPYSEKQLEEIEKLAKKQYYEIFNRQYYQNKGEKVSDIYNQPQSTYEVIYWSWRAIKAHGKKGWMYGNAKNFLSAGELEYIMRLATNPVDNFKHWTISNESQFIEMFLLVWHSFRQYHRPWYDHPSWHVKHWSFQFHPWQNLKRRYWDKCSKCGKRGFKGAANGNWSGTEIWHAECDNSYVSAGSGHINEKDNG